MKTPKPHGKHRISAVFRAPSRSAYRGAGCAVCRVKNEALENSMRGFEEAEHHREVLRAEPGSHEELVERRRLGTHRRYRARSLRRLLRQFQVLQHHVRGETRLIIAVRGCRLYGTGRRAVVRHRPALAGRLRADVEEFLDVEAELLGELEALADADHR